MTDGATSASFNSHLYMRTDRAQIWHIDNYYSVSIHLDRIDENSTPKNVKRNKVGKIKNGYFWSDYIETWNTHFVILKRKVLHCVLQNLTPKRSKGGRGKNEKWFFFWSEFL